MEELFIDSHKLPKALSKEEVYKLLELYQNGEEVAKDKLVEHNIRLVLYEVTGKFKMVDYDKKDLVSIGTLGLMKAINTFDISKKVEFATYAVRCIDNEILMFLRKLKKYQGIESLDAYVYQGNDGSEIKLEDMLSDDTNIEEDYTDNETYEIIRKVINTLPEKEQIIVKMHFGFIDDRVYTQKEIANKLQISQSYVSRLVTKIVKKVGNILKEKGLVELRSEEKKGKNEMPKELKSIYEYFNKYSKEEIDAMILKLNEDERKLLYIRYGSDLENPMTSESWNQDYVNKFYGSLIPKMKRLLANPTGERKKRKSTIDNGSGSNAFRKNEIMEDTQNNVEINIISLIRKENFFEMFQNYELKDAIIIALKLGFVDGIIFSSESIAEFFHISIEEVIDITRKSLLSYKSKLNQMIDDTINDVLGEDDKRGR